MNHGHKCKSEICSWELIVFDFSETLWTHLLYLIPSYILTHLYSRLIPPCTRRCMYPCPNHFPLVTQAQTQPNNSPPKESCRSHFRKRGGVSCSSHLQAWCGPNTLREPPYKQKIQRNMFFQVGLSQKQHTTAVLSILNWEKYQRNAEVHSLWLCRGPNLCLPASKGCLLLRAEPTSFCSRSKKEADAIKAMYWLGSLKPAAATKKVSCRTTSQTASPLRQPWWEDKSLLWVPFSDSASLRETVEAVQGQGTRQEDEEDDEEGHSRRKLEGKLSLCCPLPSSPVSCYQKWLLTSEQQRLEKFCNLGS